MTKYYPGMQFIFKKKWPNRQEERGEVDKREGWKRSEGIVVKREGGEVVRGGGGGGGGGGGEGEG